MKTTLQERAQIFIPELNEKGVDQVEIAKVAGVSKGTVNQWLSGGIKSMKLEYALYLQDAFGYNHRWLVMGEEPKWQVDRRKNVKPNYPNTSPGPAPKPPVPLISWVQAGEWCGVVDNFAPGDADEWLPCPKAHGPNTFALRVRGVSMEPKYRDGAIIFVDPGRQADHLSNVVVRLEDDKEATFKQLVVEDNKRFLRPLNPEWPGPKLMEINQSATICGVVIGQFIED